MAAAPLKLITPRFMFTAPPLVLRLAPENVSVPASFLVTAHAGNVAEDGGAGAVFGECAGSADGAGFCGIARPADNEGVAAGADTAGEEEEAGIGVDAGSGRVRVAYEFARRRCCPRNCGEHRCWRRCRCR